MLLFGLTHTCLIIFLRHLQYALRVLSLAALGGICMSILVRSFQTILLKNCRKSFFLKNDPIRKIHFYFDTSKKRIQIWSFDNSDPNWLQEDPIRRIEEAFQPFIARLRARRSSKILRSDVKGFWRWWRPISARLSPFWQWVGIAAKLATLTKFEPKTKEKRSADAPLSP